MAEPATNKVIMAFIIAGSITTGGSDAPLAIKLDNWQHTGEWLALAVFIAVMVVLAKRVLGSVKNR